MTALDFLVEQVVQHLELVIQPDKARILVVTPRVALVHSLAKQLQERLERAGSPAPFVPYDAKAFDRRRMCEHDDMASLLHRYISTPEGLWKLCGRNGLVYPEYDIVLLDEVSVMASGCATDQTHRAHLFENRTRTRCVTTARKLSL